MADRPCCRATG